VEKGFKYSSEAVKRFGLRGVLKIVSTFSWFLLPFLIWIQIYRYLGKGYFLFFRGIPGLIISLVFIVILSLLFVNLNSLHERLMKHIEHAKDVFDNPADPKSEENFRTECHKFIVPYLYFPDVFLFGFSGVLREISMLGKVFLRFLQILFNLYLSYSVMVFLTTNKAYFNQIRAYVSSLVPVSSELALFFQLFLENPIFLIALLFLLSLYSNFFVSYVRQGYSTYSRVFWDFTCDLVSVYMRVILLGACALGLPWYIRKKINSLTYKPFTFPVNLPLLIQKSVWNIEGKNCKVTRWSYVLEHENDIEILKQMIYLQEDIPYIIRAFSLGAEPRRAVNLIKAAEPTLYLGTMNKRCVILGRVEYVPLERLFRAEFFFDNRYIREEFKSIAEIEIDEQKKLKPRLPKHLVDVISKLKMEDEK